MREHIDHALVLRWRCTKWKTMICETGGLPRPNRGRRLRAIVPCKGGLLPVLVCCFIPTRLEFISISREHMHARVMQLDSGSVDTGAGEAFQDARKWRHFGLVCPADTEILSSHNQYDYKRPSFGPCPLPPHGRPR